MLQVTDRYCQLGSSLSGLVGPSGWLPYRDPPGRKPSGLLPDTHVARWIHQPTPELDVVSLPRWLNQRVSVICYSQSIASQVIQCRFRLFFPPGT